MKLEYERLRGLRANLPPIDVVATPAGSAGNAPEPERTAESLDLSGPGTGVDPD